MKSATLTDLNNDNRPDIAVTRNSDSTVGFEARAGNWLRVNVPAAKAPGARVTLSRGAAMQTVELAAGSGYLGQSVSAAFFGLGDSSADGKVRVQFADGTAVDAAFNGKPGALNVKAGKQESTVESRCRISLRCSDMSQPECPMCAMNDLLEHTARWECATCGHEWPRSGAAAEDSDGPRVVKDAFGNVLADGDCVSLIKDLKLKGSSQVIKGGTKSKPIKLGDGDHEISCKIDGMAIGLKACFVKKA